MFLSMLMLCILISWHNSPLGQAGWAQAASSENGAAHGNPSGTSPPAFEDLTARAAAAREANKIDEAIQYYQQAVNIRPVWSEGWWYIGTLYYDGDRYADAIPAFRKLVVLEPKSGPVWALLGLSEFEMGDYENSFSHLQHGEALGLKENPEVVDVAIYHTGLLLISHGKFERGSDLLVSQFGPSRFSDQVKTALGMALLRIPLLPHQVDPSNDALIRAAGEVAARLSAKDSGPALQTLQQVLKEYPHTAFLHYAYASALASVSQYREAEAQLREEARITPWSGLPHVRMALIELQLHRREEALKSAEHAVEISPGSFAAHDALRRVLLEFGRLRLAAKERVIASKLDSEVAEPSGLQASVYGIATASIQVNQQTLSSSADPSRTAPADPSKNFDQLARKAASAQRARGNAQAAIQAYRDALRLRPEWTEGRRNLAVLYYATARYSDAISVLKNLAEVDPKFGPSWGLLGLCEFETKDYKNSLVHLKRGEELGIGGNPESVSAVNYHLALLLNWNKEFDRATDLLADEVRAGRGTEQVRFALGMGLLRAAVLPSDVDPSQKERILLAGEAAAFLSSSKYDEAFAIFHKMLKEYPDTPYVHYAYGVALESVSRFDEAKVQLKEEIRASPGSALPYVRIASIDLKLTSFEEALQFATEAVRLDPQFAAAHEVLGRALLELRRTDQAIKELEAARKSAPYSPEVHFNLARAYAQAKWPERAAQERATFKRLSALMERRKSMTAAQSHGVFQDQGEAESPEIGPTPAPIPTPQ